ncbi:hypothetical protein [Streptomyces fradiae]|uniref:hypothetical protein n=1 Tax=Streptomyces fradiae TaxID=1906 RepID=UPI00398664C7
MTNAREVTVQQRDRITRYEHIQTLAVAEAGARTMPASGGILDGPTSARVAPNLYATAVATSLMAIFRWPRRPAARSSAFSWPGSSTRPTSGPPSVMSTAVLPASACRDIELLSIAPSQARRPGEHLGLPSQVSSPLRTGERLVTNCGFILEQRDLQASAWLLLSGLAPRARFHDAPTG